MLNKLKPIPSKFHYIFNLRDVGRVFQGILMIKSTKFKDQESYIRLWINEVSRVFSDRLISEDDINKSDEFSSSIWSFSSE